jgi:hypothetical protein
VKKIADEHEARVRVANLPAAAPEDGSDSPAVAGAQVSLSFSRIAAAGSDGEPQAATTTNDARAQPAH